MGEQDTTIIAEFRRIFERVDRKRLSHFDLLPQGNLAEKLIKLDLQGPPPSLPPEVDRHMREMRRSLQAVPTRDLRVAVLGGGSGLSNLMGGDSRQNHWPRDPFAGLKDYFPGTTAVVCITDDGGSTGELLKDLPLVALGDIRHVLLSACRRRNLRERYGLDSAAAERAAATLFTLFNCRFTRRPDTLEGMVRAAVPGFPDLPRAMRQGFERLFRLLEEDPHLIPLLDRPHCLGNLLLAAAIYGEEGTTPGETGRLEKGLTGMARLVGAEPEAVFPCCLTPARLQVLYSNGVLVTGEYKSGNARRGYPVDRVFVEFARQPQVPPRVIKALESADIIVLAPGSLFTSTIPVLQVPGIAEAIRDNKQALKILVSNLWVQKGETDLVQGNPRRRYYVSDLIKAYHRNIPAGVKGLFDRVLCLGLQDIPGSVIQNYAMEDKIPIYLDRENVDRMGYMPVEAGIFSPHALRERLVVQHAPDALARAIRALWVISASGIGGAGAGGTTEKEPEGLPDTSSGSRHIVRTDEKLPCERYAAIKQRLLELAITSTGYPPPDPDEIRRSLATILWQHPDIRLSHLDRLEGVMLIDPLDWHRCQQWDNVFSFYEPAEKVIKIRQDIYDEPSGFEVAFLVALGQAVLGSYAAHKKMDIVDSRGKGIGKIFRLTLLSPSERDTYFNEEELDRYLTLARMIRSPGHPLHYTRLINGNEGFTPPGLLFGLLYAWYLDNRCAAHIEYKMAVMRTELSDLIPEQVNIFQRRKALIDFFREKVFRHVSPIYYL